MLPVLAGLAGYLMSNPRRKHRRKAKKSRHMKSAKGTWKTVTTITKTVKRQKVNPPKTEKQAYDLGYSEGSDRSGMSGRLSAWPSEQDFNKPDKLVRAFMRGFSDGQKEQDRGTPAWATNPSTPLTDSSRHISHDHYFITDREAGALVKQYGNGKLPKPAYEQAIDTPEGKFWLNRTPVAYDPRFKNKRGWVWCVYPRASR